MGHLYIQPPWLYLPPTELLISDKWNEMHHVLSFQNLPSGSDLWSPFSFVMASNNPSIIYLTFSLCLLFTTCVKGKEIDLVQNHYHLHYKMLFSAETSQKKERFCWDIRRRTQTWPNSCAPCVEREQCRVTCAKLGAPYWSHKINV